MNEANGAINYMNAVLVVTTAVFVVTPVFFGFVYQQTKREFSLLIPLTISFLAGLTNLAILLNWFYFQGVSEVLKVQIILLVQMLTFLLGIFLVGNDLFRVKKGLRKKR